MKNIVIITFVLIFTSCAVGIQTQKVQVPDRAYIMVVGNPDNYEDAQIMLQYDDKEKFPVEMRKEGTRKFKKYLYEIAPGRHTIKVYNASQLLINREIFISNQETIEIQLP